jgi:hypothetical protein
MAVFYEEMKKKSWLPALLLGALLWAHGSALGPSDDEAYYWVLAQRPALGYAFHPPAVAWVITFFQKLLGGWLFPESSTALLRLPAALLSAGILWLGLDWVERARRFEEAGRPTSFGKTPWSDAWTAASLAGVFGMGWMIVPDLPLFAAWAILFSASWRVLESGMTRAKTLALFFGAALAILSKFSGVLAVGSAGLVLLLWAGRREFWLAAGALVLGAFFGLLPTLLWNARHDWQALLYQLQGRHTGGVSWVRYGRFWAIQAVLAGPALLVFGMGLVRDAGVRWEKWRRPSGLGLARRFVLAWALPPALVFCVQPLFAEFKPHWALAAWLPLVFALALEARTFPRLVRAHRLQGSLFALLAASLCHFAWLPFADPRHDVSNDLYGWSGLGNRLGELPALPVVGSRYQTASQAAFALQGSHAVTLLPRDLKQRDEWPDLGVSDGQGPGWPRLLAPVYFVADSRYSQPPEFRNSECIELPPLEAFRFDPWARLRGSDATPKPVKRILLWRCAPPAAAASPVGARSD